MMENEKKRLIALNVVVVFNVVSVVSVVVVAILLFRNFFIWSRCSKKLFFIANDGKAK